MSGIDHKDKWKGNMLWVCFYPLSLYRRAKCSLCGSASVCLSLQAACIVYFAAAIKLLWRSLWRLSFITLHKWPLFMLHATGAVFVFGKAVVALVETACMASELTHLCNVDEMHWAGWINGLMRAVVSPKSKAAPAFCGHTFSWDFYSGTVTDFYWCCSVCQCCLVWLSDIDQDLNNQRSQDIICKL